METCASKIEVLDFIKGAMNLDEWDNDPKVNAEKLNAEGLSNFFYGPYLTCSKDEINEELKQLKDEKRMLLQNLNQENEKKVNNYN